MVQNNKIISVLLAIALVLTVTSFFIGLDKFTDLGFFVITGAGSSSQVGVANLTITSVTSITNQVALLDFGSGYINTSCATCIMDSNRGSNLSGPCCFQFNSLTSGFLLENTGNENISINYSCTGNCTAAQLIGGVSPGFEMMVTNNSGSDQSGESGEIDTEASCVGLGFYGWNMTTNNNIYSISNVSREGVYNSITSNGAWLCGNSTIYPLNFKNSQDAGVVDINITIPDSAPGGEGMMNATFTFNAISAG